MSNFASKASMAVVWGKVLGISKNEVTPPKAAARVSEAISALLVKPGSRKCTCESITPGHTKHPVASTSLS